MKEMRILYSISNLLVGGAQTFLLALANEISKTNKAYIYCLSESQADPEITRKISSNVKLITFPSLLRKFISCLQTFFPALKIEKNDSLLTLKRVHFKILVKLLKIDIIHSQLYHSDEFITHIFQDHKIPVIITEHGCYNYVTRECLAATEDVIRIFKRVNGVAYISDQNKENIQKITGNNEIPFKKINNGIPRFNPNPSASQKLKKSLNINSHDFVFGMVARGIKEKGWEIAAAAFKELQKKELQKETGRRIHLIFIGDSSYLHELKKKLGTEDVHNIHFLGSISEPIHWISCFDIGLLPSYFAGETLPMTVIEYLACAKPVIATNAGNIKEMINHETGSAGIIFDYHPDFQINVHHLKEAMALYLQDPALLEKHQLLASQCFAKFDIEDICRNYEQFYKQQFIS